MATGLFSAIFPKNDNNSDKVRRLSPTSILYHILKSLQAESPILSLQQSCNHSGLDRIPRNMN